MKFVSPLLAVAILSAILPAKAQDGVRAGASPTTPRNVNDPLKNIYRISGVRDTGDTGATGVATVFHCTNPGGVSEKVKFIVRNFTGNVVGSFLLTISAGRTLTAATHDQKVFVANTFLSIGDVINQGSAQIQATSLLIHCSAMIVDAAASVPQGIALHMVRLKPAPDTQE